MEGKIKGFETGMTGDSDIATAADIDQRSVIAGECIVKPGARIVNSVIGEGVFVEERAVIEDSVIWARTRINTAAEVRGAVVGKGCYIGRNARVSPGSVLGDKTSLTDYTKA